jgi:hypothetical protein
MAVETVPIAPCVKIPSVKPIKITLPFGAELSSMVDISQGPPTDCAMAYSLMVQIAPMLAGMTCMLRVLGVITALKDFASNPLTKGPVLLGKIAEMSECLAIPANICPMIKGILSMILAYLGCVIDALDSLLHFQAGINVNLAEGNPVLQEALQCAQDNADVANQGMMDAMTGVKPLLDMISMIMEIAGQAPLEMPPMTATSPSAAEIAGGADPVAPLKTIRNALQEVRDALPC